MRKRYFRSLPILRHASDLFLNPLVSEPTAAAAAAAGARPSTEIFALPRSMCVGITRRTCKKWASHVAGFACGIGPLDSLLLQYKILLRVIAAQALHSELPDITCKQPVTRRAL